MRYLVIFVLGFVVASHAPQYQGHLNTPIETLIDIRRSAANGSVDSVANRFYGYQKDKSDVKEAAELYIAQAKFLRSVRNRWGTAAEHRIVMSLQLDDETLDRAARVTIKGDTATLYIRRTPRDVDDIVMICIAGEWKIASWNCEPEFEGAMTGILHIARVKSFTPATADIEAGGYATPEAADAGVHREINDFLEPLMRS
jgi:hypothetical protein